MHLVCIAPSLPPVADFLRKCAALSPGEWRINEGAIGIIDMRGFVSGELPHAAAWNLDVAHGLTLSLHRTQHLARR
jgi:hypothetical protein